MRRLGRQLHALHNNWDAQPDDTRTREHLVNLDQKLQRIVREFCDRGAPMPASPLAGTYERLFDDADTLASSVKSRLARLEAETTARRFDGGATVAELLAELAAMQQLPAERPTAFANRVRTAAVERLRLAEVVVMGLRGGARQKASLASAGAFDELQLKLGDRRPGAAAWRPAECVRHLRAGQQQLAGVRRNAVYAA